jgi:hypothetical protein
VRGGALVYNVKGAIIYHGLWLIIVGKRLVNNGRWGYCSVYNEGLGAERKRNLHWSTYPEAVLDSGHIVSVKVFPSNLQVHIRSHHEKLPRKMGKREETTERFFMNKAPIAAHVCAFPVVPSAQCFTSALISTPTPPSYPATQNSNPSHLPPLTLSPTEETKMGKGEEEGGGGGGGACVRC